MDTANVSILPHSCKQNAKKIFITSRFLLQNINRRSPPTTSPGQVQGGRNRFRHDGEAASLPTAEVIPPGKLFLFRLSGLPGNFRRRSKVSPTYVKRISDLRRKYR